MDFFIQILFSGIGIVLIPFKQLINYDLISLNI